VSAPLSRPSGRWRTILPGLAQKQIPAGPWFQYHDSVGFEWNIFDCFLPGLPSALDGFRIVQLSDMHCQPHWQTAYDELIDRIKADEPDLIVFTGDITDQIRTPWKCLPTARKLIAQLRAFHGLLGITGNHDLRIRPGDYNGTPLRLIDGQRILLNHCGAQVELIGVPGPERIDCPPDFAAGFPTKKPGVPRIVLSHFPDHIRKLKVLRPDIFLSGHTHGGQICLPGRVPILRHDSLPMKYFQGAHRLHDAWFFVSRGFGFSTSNYRLFCPSEVIEIRLRSVPLAASRIGTCGFAKPQAAENFTAHSR
jgi:predicted MPP superfamily phosphohydrolase